ncbi:low specificity L-threonine aldolase [Agrobacterium vitis]|uniref:threonine aldolase family protein n=1 Tax=Allorhizobium ampelinum TaxID=3025782 RepID=UPI001F1625DE|nr:low specificity L-threonine aldolase [Allorhizobium ampelinum]MCF1470474.1 low specificity L-threonine aldolase [Allorhizobium ampelinum]
MFFASDNWAGAHPAIAESLMKEAAGYASAYGTSDLDRRVEAHFNEIFEREVSVFFVGTGTAANSLALASVARAGGVTFCHFDAHVNADEGGAPEYLANASRLYPVEGRDGKMSAAALHTAVSRFDTPSVHQGRPMAVTITQATEAGTIYTLDEISTISAIARAKSLPLHMDGARFANALVALDATPAEMTWKRGVDILSFGGTKNGCWCVEAIVFFNPDMAEEMPYIRKRSAQLFSKTRFVSAQLEAYFKDDLWLDLARHANAMAERMRAGLNKNNKARLAWNTESNEVFAVIGKDAAKQAEARGAKFYEWLVPRDEPGLVGQDNVLIRLVTSFATTEQDVDQFLDIL